VIPGSRIEFVLGDQDDPAIVPLVGEPGTFDVIIDDCSHEAGRTVRSFELYRPLLKPNGIYVVEDLETSYPPADHHPAQIGGSLGFFKGLVDWINIEPGGGSGIEQIAFYRRMVVLHFGVNM
jgi:predicted O-methyltransferase YrrM